MAIEFGSFDGVCETAALIVCPLVGTGQGIEPVCYSRNVDVGGTLIFQPSTCFVHVVALFMTAIMIYHVRSKYTAVGRREIVMFFYLYAIIELLAFFLDSNIIPSANVAYPWFAAAYTGLVAAAYTCLLINGFVGFQFAEDGTPLSLWFLRLSCLVVFGVGFFLAIATFQSFAGFSFAKPLALWIIYLLWPLVCAVVYTVSQLVLVFRTLDDRWPLGDIVFGAAFFTVAQVTLFAFSTQICDAIKHYIDGLFFFHLCMLLSVMMVYKYWDSITKEDLEFSVGSKQAVWDIKDPLLAASSSGPLEYRDDPDDVQPGLGYGPGQHGGFAQGGGQGLYQNGGKGGYGPAGRGYPPGGY